MSDSKPKSIQRQPPHEQAKSRWVQKPPHEQHEYQQYWRSIADAITEARRSGDVAPLLTVSWHKWWHPLTQGDYLTRYRISHYFARGDEQSANVSIATLIQQHAEVHSQFLNPVETQAEYATTLEQHLERKRRDGRLQGDLRLSELRDELIDCFSAFEIDESEFRGRPRRLLVGESPPIPGKDIPSLVWPSHRQFARWAAKRVIPGAYPIKRGHYRVRICPQLILWATKHIMQHAWEEHCRELRRDFPTLDAVIRERSLEAKLNPDIVLLLDAPLRNVPVAFLPTKFFEKAVLYAERLRIGEIVNCFSTLATPRQLKAMLCDGKTTIELEPPSRAGRIKVSDVIRASGLKRATFYRRGYDKIVKELRRKPEPEVIKDPRAKKLYKNQVLQENETND